MKKLQLFALLLFLCSTLSAQEYTKIDTVLKEFYYNYQFQPDSTDMGKQQSQAMVLQIGKLHSKFTPVNRLLFDSLLFKTRNMDKHIALNMIMPYISQAPISDFCCYRLLKNYPKKGMYELWGNFGGRAYAKEDGKLQFNWKLNTAKDTTILGYKCYKAACRFAGRDYVAWYTPDIPISNGPYKFTGLPGLILSVADTKNQHRFHIYKIKDNVKREIFLFLKKKKYKPCSPKEYVKTFYWKNNNLAQRLRGNNSKIKFKDDASKAGMLYQISSKNNYIEQYR